MTVYADDYFEWNFKHDNVSVYAYNADVSSLEISIKPQNCSELITVSILPPE